jgi:hypothetical protein
MGKQAALYVRVHIGKKNMFDVLLRRGNPGFKPG